MPESAKKRSSCAVSHASGDESFRLQVLHDYRILDTPPERPFDDIARFAAELCSAPIGCVSLVGADRLQCKAAVGTQVRDYERAHTFCDAAIRSTALLEVPDALLDTRFIANPYIKGPPHIRFYAGAPLVTQEAAILGTVCVIDRVPRRLSKAQATGLQLLARQVVNMLELRRRDLEREFLRCAGERLGARLQSDAALAQAASLAAAFLGDVCVIDLLGPHGSWSRAHIAHAQASDAALAGRLLDLGRRADGQGFALTSRVLAARRSVVLLQENHDEVQDALGGAALGGTSSVMCLPLISRGQGQGVLTLLGREPRPPFGASQVALAEAFASMAALALDNARLYDEAHQATALRDEFIDIAAHELRTPLTALRVQTESLERAQSRNDADLCLAARRKVPRMRAQLDRLQTLVDELVSVSQIQGQKVQIDPEAVDLGDEVAKIVKRYTGPAQQVGSTLTYRHPAQPTPVRDRIHVAQVVEHLLVNALRYGLGRPVDIEVFVQDDCACLTVRDHGLGIAPERQETIFKRFMRLNSAQNYGGLGLGLWLVREIVNAMHGQISVTSAVGDGTYFTLRLPFALK